MNEAKQYEIYCCYHRDLFPDLYGNQLDQVVFAKLGEYKPKFKPPKELDPKQFKSFRPLGKQFSETEFMLNLHYASDAGEYRLPEFLGFVQYDMDWCNSKNESIIDRVNKFDFNNHNKVIAFQYCPGDCIRRQTDGTLQLAQQLLAERNIVVTDEQIDNNWLAMCCSWFVHHTIFREICHLWDGIIDDPRVKAKSVIGREQGGVTERIACLYLLHRKVEMTHFNVYHQFFGGK
jgi:hypothetical protein